MADILKKVQAGDKLRISATAWNEIIDTTRKFKQQQHGRNQDIGREFRQTGIVKVQNQSGGDRERFDVLGISGPIIGPEDNLSEFQNQVALLGVAPLAEHHGQYVILLEPLRAGAIGKAVVSGVTVARVQVDAGAEDARFAEAADGMTSSLLASASGSARILWKEPGVGEKWSIVRLGDSSGGAPFIYVEETPAGIIDGVNRVFTLNHVPSPASLRLYLNGLLQHSGPENDYVLSGTTITISSEMVPYPGDVLFATYNY